MLPRPALLVSHAPRVSQALLVAFATLLTGCWTSTAALMPASARDSAPIAGEYVLAENADPYGQSGFAKPPARLRARALLGNLLRIEPLDPAARDAGPRTVSFDELEPGLYLAQATFDKPGTRIDYYIVGIEDGGASVMVLVPPCGEAQRQLGGKPVKGDGEVCQWSGYGALRKAATELVKADAEKAGIRQLLLYKRS